MAKDYVKMMLGQSQEVEEQKQPQENKQVAKQEKPQQKNYVDMLLGNETKIEQGGDVETIQYGDPYDISFSTRSKAAFVDDPQKKREIVTRELLPNVPAGQRENLIFERGGETVVYDPFDKKYHPVPKETIEEIGAGFVGKAPTMIGDIVGAIAGAGYGPPGMVAGATAGGTAGEYTRQLIGKQFLGDPMHHGEVGKEAALAGAGEFAFGALPVWFKQRNLARDISRMDTKSTRALEKKAEEWGVPLTPAETTNLGSLIQKQKLLSKRADEAGDILARFGEERSGKLYNSINDFMDLISAEDSVIQGNMRGAKAVRDYIDEMDSARRQATKPLYEQAKKEGIEVDVSGVIDKIDDLSSTLAGRERGKLNKIKKDLKTDKGVLKNDIESLDNVKKSIDDDIATAKRQGRRYQVSLLQDIKSDLVAKMDEASPAYQSARTKFSEMSGGLNKVEGTTLEQINKLKEEKINQIGDMTLNSRKSSPQVVTKVKSAMGAQDPGAWNDVVRGYMQDLIEQKVKDPEQGNIAGIIQKQLWGSEKQKKIWREALDSETYGKMKDLMDVFEAANRASKGESWTAMAQAAQQDIRKEAASIVRRPLINAILNSIRWTVNPFGAAQRASSSIQDFQMDTYVKQIAKALTDPGGRKQIQELKKMSPKSKRFWAGMGALMAEITHGSLAEATEGDVPIKEGFDYIQYIKENFDEGNIENE